MNHDYAHCLDFITYACPKSCFRAQLVRDLENNPNVPQLISWAHLAEIEKCGRKEKKNEQT